MMVNSEIKDFNGIRYYRYPEAKNWCAKWYFRCENKIRLTPDYYLHRAIWRFHNGEIPKGFHIHHKDGNPLNNEIDNLQCLSPSDHRKSHYDFEKYSGMGKKAWDQWVKVIKKCTHCLKEYEVYRASQSKYCSNSCLSIARYNSGIDNIEKECQECGKMYYCNKYKIKISCSRKCADAISSKTKSRNKVHGELWF